MPENKERSIWDAARKAINPLPAGTDAWTGPESQGAAENARVGEAPVRPGTITYERPGGPVERWRPKPVVMPKNPLDIMNIPGQDIAQAAHDIVGNLMGIRSMPATPMAPAVQPAGAPVMPGQVMPAGAPAMPDPVAAQPMGADFTTIAGDPAPQPPAGDVSGAGQPVQPAQPLPTAYAPPPAAAPGALQQPGQPAQPWPTDINASSQLAGEWLAKSGPAAKNADNLLALTNDFLRQYGAGAIARLDAKNPIKLLYDAHMAKPEGDGTAAAEAITGKKSAATIQGEKSDAARVKMEVQAERINAATQKQIATERTAIDRRVEATITKIEGDESLTPQVKADKIRNLIEKRKARYGEEAMPGKLAAIVERVAAGNSYFAEKDRPLLTPEQNKSLKDATANIIRGRSVEVDTTIAEQREYRRRTGKALGPKKKEFVGSVAPIVSLEDFRKVNPGKSREDFQKTAYSGGKYNGKEYAGLAKGFEEFKEKAARYIESQTYGPKNAEKRKKLLAELDNIAREQWEEHLFTTSRELYDAWIANDPGSEAKREETIPAPSEFEAPPPKAELVGETKSQGNVPRGTSTGATGQIPTVGGDDDFNRLPSGTVFIGPDGKKRRKP